MGIKGIYFLVFQAAIVVCSSSTLWAQPQARTCPASLISPTAGRTPASGAPGIRYGIAQVTYADKDLTIADPYVERSANGKVRIFGTTGGHFLEYASEEAMFGGQRPKRIQLNFTHPDGTDLKPEEMIWDSLPVTCQIDGKMKTVILAGAMTPKNGQRNAKWPDDNPGRRTYPFVQNIGMNFVRGEKPVLPDFNPHDWIGHNYGRDFVRDENGKILKDKDGSMFMIYEKVTRKTQSGALITELAMRKMRNCPYQIDPTEKVFLKIDERRPYPSVTRTDGGLLMEGPRISRMKIGRKYFFVLGFSSGDFPTDKYGINLAYSERIDGPYRPLMTPKNGGYDLLDLGKEIREQYQLSWGPARPAFYKDKRGQMWVMFHAIDKRQYPGVDFSQWPQDLAPFHRQLYMVPLTAGLKQGKPVFKLRQVKCQDPVVLAQN